MQKLGLTISFGAFVLIALATAINSVSSFQRWHGQIEKHLEKSGITWTHLQPNMLMQNIRWFAQAIAQQGSIFSTVGDAKISHVDARDVAAVAAVCLSESGHENKSYVLTGSEAIAFNEVAEKLAKALNRPVVFVNVTSEQLKQARLAGGEPEWYLDSENELFALWASGAGSPVTTDIKDVAKKSPTSFDEFARDLAKEKTLDFFNVERVASGFTFGEGPVYDAAQGYFLFCDTQGDTIHKLLPDDKLEVFRHPAGYPSGLAFDSQGRLVVCENAGRRITRTEKDGQIVTLAEKFEEKRFNSPNDLVIRSDDTIYFSDPPYGLPEMSQGKELDFNGVYKISPDGKLSLLIKDIQLPNGMVFSPDERFLYET
ncbi:MAG: SMP-30/gluconolactonase/LRE family protein [Heteroscytonema crispum UTEX LB 1556]